MNLFENMMRIQSNDPMVQSNASAVPIRGQSFVVALFDRRDNLIGWMTLAKYLALNDFGAFTRASAFSDPDWAARCWPQQKLLTQHAFPLRMLENGLRKRSGEAWMPRWVAVVPFDAIGRYMALVKAGPQLTHAVVATNGQVFSLRHAEILSMAKGWHEGLDEVAWIARVQQARLSS